MATTSPEQAVDLETRAPQTGVKLKDMLVLMQLREAGADLTAPRHVLYYLYFFDQAAAESAGRAAAEEEFEVTVEGPEPGRDDTWSVVCELESFVLSMDIVRDNTDFFEELAARFGGEYDGWEASAD